MPPKKRVAKKDEVAVEQEITNEAAVEEETGKKRVIKRPRMRRPVKEINDETEKSSRTRPINKRTAKKENTAPVEVMEEVQEEKTTKRGRKKQPAKPETDEPTAETEVLTEVAENSSKRGRKKTVKAEPIEENKTEDVSEDTPTENEENKTEDVPEDTPTENEEKITKKGRKKAAPKDEKPAEIKKATKGRKTVVKAPEKANDANEDGKEGGETKGRKRRAVNEEKPVEEKKKKKEVIKPEETEESSENEMEETTYECTKENSKGQLPNMKITSWNVAGLKAWVGKNGLDYIKNENPDVFCLQETRCNEKDLPEEMKSLDGYPFKYFADSEKKGHAGVALFSKTEPISIKIGIGGIEEEEKEGRCVTVEFETFYLINVYVPNAGKKLVTLDKRLKWNEVFKNYVVDLDKKKPVIVCGDMNVAHEEIDLKNPKTNKRNAGFTQEERDGMTEFLEQGLVDSFRKMYPEDVKYTFWTYFKNARAKGIGWRLDYFIVSERIFGNICDNEMRTKVFGSDHCPITLHINI